MDLVNTHNRLLFIALSSLIIGVACTDEIVPEVFRPRNDHEAYLHSLEKASLLETALGHDWQEVAFSCFDQSIAVELPYTESFYIAKEKPSALAYTFAARRGEKIQVKVDLESNQHQRTFIDVFRIDTSSAQTQRLLIASADQDHRVLSFEPRRDAKYQLRIQPELLRGGKYHLTLLIGPSLEFPVLGANNHDIGSFFGDPRDGGRRKHHGIDIFARRHTPIVAPTDGYIRFVGERGLGGRVIWMRDQTRDMTLYFAHLQDLWAEEDTWVKAGDTLGTVGNTGNARTTPPHLHFGIYKNGPIDPYYFVAKKETGAKEIKGNLDWVGLLVRARHQANLSMLSNDTAYDVRLPKYQLLRILGCSGSRYRVEKPDGTLGLIHNRDVELLDQPIQPPPWRDTLTLFNHLHAGAVPIDNQVPKAKVKVLAKDTHHWYVQSENGHSGWILSTAP